MSELPMPITKVLIKTGPDFSWPEDERIFYILGKDGLYLCRNHEFFRSCVPAERGPSELEAQEPFLVPRFPRIPRDVFERIVGFFDRVAELYGSEAAAMLAWDREQKEVRLVVPEQTATVYRSSWDGYTSPIGVHYVPPADLPPAWLPFGDVHSHVHGAAYASSVDKHDELHDAGLHLVVGRIEREPPEIHVEAVVDGRRFVLDPGDVIEEYRARRADVAQQWLDRVRVEESSSWYSGSVA